MFYDVYLKLCREHGEAPTSLLTKLGISKGTIKNWKTGSEPTNRNAKLVAEYFGLSVDDLMSGRIEKATVITNGGLSQKEKDFLDIIRGLNQKNLDSLAAHAEFLRDQQLRNK